MTHVEQCVVEQWEGWARSSGRSVPKLSYIRSLLRQTAYHEAGHTAARFFTGHEPGHVVSVTIVPTQDWIGVERSEQNITEVQFHSWPRPLLRTTGRRLLLCLLAGRGAEARVTDPENRQNILDDDALWDEGEKEGTDLFRALRIATIMAHPGMPKDRILTTAERWTHEMLAIPEVWRTVDSLASTLLARGTIKDPDEIMKTCNGIYCMAMRLPKWRHRLYLYSETTLIGADPAQEVVHGELIGNDNAGTAGGPGVALDMDLPDAGSPQTV